jgi:hypothetical protein
MSPGQAIRNISSAIVLSVIRAIEHGGGNGVAAAPASRTR